MPSIGIAVAIFVALFVGMALTPVGQWIAGGGGGDNKKDVKPATDSKHVAILNHRHNAVWLEGTRPPLNDPRLNVGRRLKLASGLIEIKYNTGARVVIEGPAEFEVVGKKNGYLQFGKLRARVEDETAKGFIVDTPTSQVEDLGTEFGVTVSRQATTTLAVVEGKVRVRGVNQDGSMSEATIIRARGSAQFAQAIGCVTSPAIALVARGERKSDC